LYHIRQRKRLSVVGTKPNTKVRPNLTKWYSWWVPQRRIMGKGPRKGMGWKHPRRNLYVKVRFDYLRFLSFLSVHVQNFPSMKVGDAVRLLGVRRLPGWLKGVGEAHLPPKLIKLYRDHVPSVLITTPQVSREEMSLEERLRLFVQSCGLGNCQICYACWGKFRRIHSDHEVFPDDFFWLDVKFGKQCDESRAESVRPKTAQDREVVVSRPLPERLLAMPCVHGRWVCSVCRRGTRGRFGRLLKDNHGRGLGDGQL